MSSPTPPSSYAGDLSVQDSWALLQSDPRAQLIDVRTQAEWSFVGIPDLSGLGREVHLVEWQTFPAMQLNSAFAGEAARAAGPDKSAPVLFLCRSGARSRSAAIALTQAGYSRAYNVAGGFEGDLDGERHRGNRNGWKAAGLPWKQT
ncbi:MAG TPA: rhodanese-like domain-containing protein [Rhizomicrobium sp.]|nr:rhodanese-like domain-containing protein [Rhizomicrobium sp.]